MNSLTRRMLSWTIVFCVLATSAAANGILPASIGQVLLDQPLQTSGFIFQLSESETVDDTCLYEDFQGVQGQIGYVQWCNVTGTFTYLGDIWTPSQPDSDTFIISFYTDNNGAPGERVYEETIAAQRVDGPEVLFGSFTAHHYTARLAAPVSLASGFVGIQHVYTGPSLYRWCQSPVGNGHSVWRYQNQDYVRNNFDLNLRLSAVVYSEQLQCTFSATPNPALPPATVQFHGIVSGEEGEPVTWHWDFGDGTTATGGPDISHIYAATGDYTVTASVSSATRTANETAVRSILVSETLPALSTASIAILAIAVAVFGAATVRRRTCTWHREHS